MWVWTLGDPGPPSLGGVSVEVSIWLTTRLGYESWQHPVEVRGIEVPKGECHLGSRPRFARLARGQNRQGSNSMADLGRPFTQQHDPTRLRVWRYK